MTQFAEIELVEIPAGSFLMGSRKFEAGRGSDESPQHRVSVAAFQIGQYAVTNEEYGRFLAAHPETTEPRFWGDRNYNRTRQPIVGVSWEEARRFAAWVGGRLATEAEWEYAARAGTTRDEPNRFAWHFENAEDRLHKVGDKEPNAWGLYDVLGNVWEWTEDDWHASYTGAPDDGSAWVDTPRADSRVVRGGSFHSTEYTVRAASRSRFNPVSRSNLIGFRVLVSPFSSDSDRA